MIINYKLEVKNENQMFDEVFICNGISNPDDRINSLSTQCGC